MKFHLDRWILGATFTLGRDVEIKDIFRHESYRLTGTTSINIEASCISHLGTLLKQRRQMTGTGKLIQLRMTIGPTYNSTLKIFGAP